MYYVRQIYLCNFHISKLNDLKVIHDVYSQCLAQALYKTTPFTKPEGVRIYVWTRIFSKKILGVHLYTHAHMLGMRLQAFRSSADRKSWHAAAPRKVTALEEATTTVAGSRRPSQWLWCCRGRIGTPTRSWGAREGAGKIQRRKEGVAEDRSG
jgi:hypothetical protein